MASHISVPCRPGSVSARPRVVGAGSRNENPAPGTQVVGVAITGAVDIVRFPRRPRLRVEFFLPAGGPPHEGESAIALTRRVMVEVRTKAPPVACGRHPEAVVTTG